MPSGQALVLWQVLWERVEGQGTQAVLRFIAPRVDPAAPDTVDEATAQADLDWLCETHALPLVALPYARSDSVVVTLMDRPVPRGTADPEATQYFATYRVEDGACIPEMF